MFTITISHFVGGFALGFVCAIALFVGLTVFLNKKAKHGKMAAFKNNN